MEIKIFWCRFNKYYAQKWANFLWKKENSILIASCAVTDNAKKKFIKEIKQQVKKWKHIFLTWCGAFVKNWEIDVDRFYNTYPELKEFKNKITLLPENPDNYSKSLSSQNFSSDLKSLQTSNSSDLMYTKGFVIVQLGCDSHCTFCITVKKRWKHKNKNVKEIINEINEMEKKWIKEIVLTWINLAAWWLNTTNQYPNPHFPKLLKQILENTSIPRIRISSIWPEFIENSWYEILENERILPYFHLSIQSWSDKILKAMGRHYTRKNIENIITNLRKLKKSIPINIWADIIVWFPGETENDFLETYNLAKNFNITKLHVFPFSSHQIWDTVPASKFPNQVSNEIKKERERKLIEICNKNYEKLIKQTKWKTVKVLIEKDNSWWTENYLKYESKRNLKNWEIYEVIF